MENAAKTEDSVIMSRNLLKIPDAKMKCQRAQWFMNSNVKNRKKTEKKDISDSLS